MAFYGGYRRVATEPFEGAVEITAEQYAQALEGMMDGLEVSMENGFALILPTVAAPPPFDPGVEPDAEAPAPSHNGTVDDEQNRRLSTTDWYVIRALDPTDGRPVPPEIDAARARIREGGRALRALSPNIPADFREDKYWMGSPILQEQA